jgi:ribonuclease Y
MMNFLMIALALIVGFAIGMTVYFIIQKQKMHHARNAANNLLEQAKRNVEKLEREAYVKAKEKLYSERNQFQSQVRQKESEMSKEEERLRKKEKELRRLENNVREKEMSISKAQKEIEVGRQKVGEEQEKLKGIIEKEIQQLERISGLQRDEAKQRLMDKLLAEAKSEASQMIIDIKNEAQENARWESIEIMAHAMEKMATEYTMESTLISVSLPNDSWKGLIIGREGRNIKSFEAATGVKVIVDDTPETVVMSSFDPIKREIARITMERLIKAKNINPKAIDTEVEKAQKIVEDSIRQAANETLRELNIKNVHQELKECLGKLKYRTSYGQNILHHSKEVAWLSGNMAAELGLDVMLARRAGLFHDIGKAVSSDSEGSHVSIGVELTKRLNEHPVVINSILAHHEEAEPISPLSVLVTAADRISGARPGARRESLEAYAQRITKLEELANSFEGVAKTYALSAGREIRVMIIPDQLSDKDADMLASDIARKIKDTMEYPGQIKVTVIRQLVAYSSTDEFSAGKNTEKIAVSENQEGNFSEN